LKASLGWPMSWKKCRGNTRTAEARSHTATSLENDPV